MRRLDAVLCRIAVAAIAGVTALGQASAQSLAGGCYRFDAPYFYRYAWRANTVSVDTTRLIELTSVSHPRTAIARTPDSRVLRAFLPRADSLYRSGVPTTSWDAPTADSVALYWFTAGSFLEFSLRIRGDTLLGVMQNHADRVEGPLPPRQVRAVRIDCPGGSSSNE